MRRTITGSAFLLLSGIILHAYILLAFMSNGQRADAKGLLEGAKAMGPLFPAVILVFFVIGLVLIFLGMQKSRWEK